MEWWLAQRMDNGRYFVLCFIPLQFDSCVVSFYRGCREAAQLLHVGVAVEQVVL